MAMDDHCEPRSTMTRRLSSFCVLPSTFKQPCILLSNQQHFRNLHQQDQGQCCLKLGYQNKLKRDETCKHSGQSPMRDQGPPPVYFVRDSACQHSLLTSGAVIFTTADVWNFYKSSRISAPSKSCHADLICENAYPRPVHNWGHAKCLGDFPRERNKHCSGLAWPAHSLGNALMLFLHRIQQSEIVPGALVFYSAGHR